MKHIADKLDSEKYAKQKKWRMKQKKQGKALKQLYLSASEAEEVGKLLAKIQLSKLKKK